MEPRIVNFVTHDIIVVGASAGGVQALRELVAGLPREITAAILVVVHMPSFHRSELAAVLMRSGPLPAVPASDEEPIQLGHIYVAQPDYHLLIRDSRLQLWRGPKENRHRPAVNVLFRSAAVECGRRAVGVVLSGSLDDGTAGLWWIKRHGGIAVVQDPSTAIISDMPENALLHVQADYVLPAASIGPLLGKLAAEPASSESERQWKHPDEELPTWKRSN